MENPKVISGNVRHLVVFFVSLQLIFLALFKYRSVKISYSILSSLRKLKNDFLGDIIFSRVLFTGRKFYINLHIPGFPSKISIRNQLGELNRLHPVQVPNNRLRILFLSITNKCPLQCKHCYEWDNLNKPEELTIGDYREILLKFTKSGVGQVHFGGGEPLLNYHCLIELTRFLRGRSEIWIATSGLGLSAEKARELKDSGLTGAVISVDHYEEGFHNEFRGSEKSFNHAMEATKNSLDAGLITCWSICAIREFISKDNLYRYASFAASKGVHFIQIFEPMPAGRFKGQDVMLQKEHISILEDFYLEYNADKSLKGMPLVTYHGYHQRRMGCMGNGNRYIYIDAGGNLHSCPFCRNDHQIKSLDLSVDVLLERIATEKCDLGIEDYRLKIELLQNGDA